MQNEQQMAQSPPPPQISLEYNFQNRQQQLQQQQQMQADELIASPHSLPNFKMLDNQLQQHQFLNNRNNEPRSSGHGNNNACSLVTTAPDDFVFIESVS